MQYPGLIFRYGEAVKADLKEVKRKLVFREDDRICLPTVVYYIWKGNNYRNTVIKKIEKAHEEELEQRNGSSIEDLVEFPRKPPFYDTIMVKIDKTEEYLTKWCHKDKEAKERLSEFLTSKEWQDMKDLHKRIFRSMYENEVDVTVNRLKRTLDELFSKFGNDSEVVEKYARIRDALVDK